MLGKGESGQDEAHDTIFGKNAGGCWVKADFGRTYPPIADGKARGGAINRNWPAGSAPPGSAGRVRIFRGQIFPNTAAGLLDMGPNLQEFVSQKPRFFQDAQRRQAVFPASEN